MIRRRSLARLASATTLLALGLPATTTVAGAAAAMPRTPVLDVPASFLRAPSVPVIVELTSPRPSLLDRSPQLQSLLDGVRSNLLGVLRADHAQHVYPFHLIPAVAATVPGRSIMGLLDQRGVGAVVLDQYHPLPAMPDAASLNASVAAARVKATPRYAIDSPPTIEPESYSLTRADVAQQYGFDGKGVRVAVVDSGLDLSQPDLAGVAATDASGRPLRVDFTGTDLRDTVGHGTACASMIAAQGRVVYTGDTLYQTDNGGAPQIYQQGASQQIVYRSHFRVRGMAPGVRILSAKIFDTRVAHDGGYDSWIVRAIEWAVDNHADVISESFGGLSVPSNGTDPTAIADEAAIRAGVTVVAADGNEGPGQTTISSPANAPGVIAVGASTEYRAFGQIGYLAPFGRTTNDNIASFTSRGPTTDGRPRPDLVAPGAFSWALFPMQKSSDGPELHPPFDVGTFGGTSKATPVAAGAAALVVEAFERTHGGARPSPALVRTILMSSAHDLGYPSSDQGAGRVDAWKAVQTTLHGGPSFLLGPGSLSVDGPQAAPISRTFAITNSGSTIQHFTISAVTSRETGMQSWGGSVAGTALQAYHFAVAPGLERIVGAVYWSSADRYDVKGQSKPVEMRVSLYDPQGRFVNYSYGVGSGYAAAQVARPTPGMWTVVVSQGGQRDPAGVSRFAAHESFQARVSTFVTVPFGSFAPAAVTLAPGHSTHITMRAVTPLAPGSETVSVHVVGDHTATLPVALTSFIDLHGGASAFGGTFTGPSSAYFSLSNENKVYSLNVPVGARSLRVSLSWPDTGYGVILLLIDPKGEIVDGQFNGIASSGSSSPFDLSAHDLAAMWSNPTPGRWQIVVMDAVFAGKQRTEPFSVQVSLRDVAVAPNAFTYTVLPGATFNVGLGVRNNNGHNVAEGYIGYATTDSYSFIPLGEVHAHLGNPRKSGTSIFSYTTGFVPPGTKMLVSSIAALNPTTALDLSFADPIGFARAQGANAPIVVDGRRLSGTTATVTGHELPIGQWSGEVTLRRPADAGRIPNLVGASYAYALTPHPWVTFDHGLHNGRITGGQPLILLPGQHDQLHAAVTVPLSAAPGVYHAQLFVYTVFGDQAASIPLTIVVQPQSGMEPARLAP